ncbi:MAG: polysaccharide deacetylase family protein [Chloroflexi bacterium]|nr:polysaccharide deacetylase family protein [Chloroflexota bacterium]
MYTGLKKQLVKKAKFWVILLLLVATTIVACQQPGDPPPQAIPSDAKLVCLFFDDCWYDQFDVALPILLQHDFKATFGVITESVGTGESTWKYMGVKELKELAGYGMDIANHTKTHPHLAGAPTEAQLRPESSEAYGRDTKTPTKLSDEQLHEEIIDSKRHLEDWSFRVRTFVYPYYAYDDRVIGYVKQAGYICARSGGQQDTGPYDLKTTDVTAKYHVPSYPIVDQNFEQFKAIVDQATRYSVVCLTYHHISDVGPVETSTRVADFAAQMRYLKEAGFTVVLLPDLFE